mmetsp:Transcript_49421/g.72502  ORF Transcript_49421/g.72502 Transcript_49421/m.72502 type:complete len:91 (-) Transcript_49421:607-879(-)
MINTSPHTERGSICEIHIAACRRTACCAISVCLYSLFFKSFSNLGLACLCYRWMRVACCMCDAAPAAVFIPEILRVRVRARGCSCAFVCI